MAVEAAAGMNSQRQRILQVAAGLFARNGYHAVGMSEIQAAVGLGRGALYHHIRSKDDLLYDIVRDYIADLGDFAARIDANMDPRERLRTLGAHLVRQIAAHQDELTVCFREVNSLSMSRRAEVLALHARYEHAWRDLLRDGASRGCFRPFDPIVLKAVLGMYFYSYLWIRADGPLGADAIAQRLNDLALRMVAAQPVASA